MRGWKITVWLDTEDDKDAGDVEWALQGGELMDISRNAQWNVEEVLTG